MKGRRDQGRRTTKPNQTRDRGGNGINDFYYCASANGQCGQSLTELNSLNTAMNTAALHKAKVLRGRLDQKYIFMLLVRWMRRSGYDHVMAPEWWRDVVENNRRVSISQAGRQLLTRMLMMMAAVFGVQRRKRGAYKQSYIGVAFGV